MASERYIGLMSGTSVDGIDAVLADFSGFLPRLIGAAHVAFPRALREELNALQRSGPDEIHRAALAANELMDCCVKAVDAVRGHAGLAPQSIAAIGVHGQTIRHRPDLGYTTQIANPARLAERTGISVVADFRSRDVAAGGQGAPLVPALHAALFAKGDAHRAIVNLGGIANVTNLPPHGPVSGFDTGPGNTLLDAWCERYTGKRFDRDGAWGAAGVVIPELLRALKEDSYFALPPPKSTGRDRFHLEWLEGHVARLQLQLQPVDVQRTLLALTAETVAEAIALHCGEAGEILVCGGGANNAALLRELEAELRPRQVSTTATLGIPVDQVEALAFAWLARERLAGRPGNLPNATGARGPRILGAVYPA